MSRVKHINVIPIERRKARRGISVLGGLRFLHCFAVFGMTLLCALSFSQPAYAVCSNPAGAAGTILYNSDSSVPQYCDDTNWIRMAPPSSLLYGMLGWWKFDESGAATTAVDSSGNGNGGTLTNFVAPSGWVSSGMADGALYISAADNVYVDLSSDPIDSHTYDDFTISAWYKSDDTTTPDDQTIFLAGDPPVSSRDAITLMVTDDPGYVGDVKLYIQAGGVGGHSYYSNGVSLLDQAWHHVVTVRHQGRVQIYVDGALITDSTEHVDTAGKTIDPQLANSTYIGDDPDRTTIPTGTEQLMGTLDDVRIYSRALKGPEIQALYQYGAGSTGDYANGLISWWKLDETSSPAVDSGSAGNDGTWTNNPVYSAHGLIDGMLQFDTTNNNYVSIPDTGSIYQTAPFTIAGWVYLNRLASESNSQIFFRMRHSVSPWNAYQAAQDSASDLLLFTVRDSGGTNYNLFSDSPLKAKHWYHVALTLDGSYNATLYVNGAAQVDTESPGSLYAADSDLRLGGNNGSSQNLDGAMDDVRFYNRALSADDIKALYLNSTHFCVNPDGVAGQLYYNDDIHVPMYCDGRNWIAMAAPEAPTYGLVGWWKLDETSGSTLFNSAGGGNDATWQDGVDSVITTEAVTGKRGGALNFAVSQNSKARTNSGAGTTNLDNLAPLSVCIWAKPAGVNGAGSWAIFNKRRGATYGNGGWALGLNGAGGQKYSFVTNMKDYRNASNYTWVANVWTHVCGTWDGTDGDAGIKIYINGEEDTGGNSGTSAGVNDDAAYDIELGYDDASSSTYDGLLDDARIYNRVLSAAEVRAIYASPAAQSYRTQTYRDLVAYWPMNDDGGTTATDVAGGNIGYASGGTVTFSSVGGKIGGAVTLDGVGGYVEVPHSEALNFQSSDPFSISAWIYRNDNTTEDDVMEKVVPGSYQGYAIYMDAASDDLAFTFNNNGTTNGIAVASSGGVVTAAAWHHFVITYDGSADQSGVTFYVDGSDPGSSFWANTLTDSTQNTEPLNIGSDTGDPCCVFNGKIDDFRIYNRVLTTSEVTDIYNAGTNGHAAEDCTSPTAAEGVMLYNTDVNAIQYCDGTNWVRLGK